MFHVAESAMPFREEAGLGLGPERRVSELTMGIICNDFAEMGHGRAVKTLHIDQEMQETCCIP